jgi:hypothetical protein
MQALLEGDAEPLTRKLIEKALAGDATCLRLCVERLYPLFKSVPPPVMQDGEGPRVINLRIFEDTGTAAGLKEVLESRDEAEAIQIEQE